MRTSIRFSSLAGRLIIALLAGGRIEAATRTWSGAAGGGLWSNAGNWSGGVPMDGDEVVFSTAGGGDSFGNLTLSLTEIRFAPAILPEHDLHLTSGTTLTLTGFGINNISLFSGGGVIRQQLSMEAASTLTFQNTATIGGSDPVFNLPVDLNALGGTTAGEDGGKIVFENNSSASGPPAYTFTGLRIYGAVVAGAGGSEMRFRDDAKMGATASFANFGGQVAGAQGGLVVFEDRAMASGNTTNATGDGLGGRVIFQNNAVAGGDLSFTNQGATHAAPGAEAVAQFIDDSALSGSWQNGAGVSGGRLEFRQRARFDGTPVAPELGSIFIVNRGSFGAGTGGQTVFHDDSRIVGANVFIGNGTESEGENPGGVGGTTEFLDRSLAGHATMHNDGATSGAAGTLGGRTFFRGDSSAENANITSRGGSGEAGAAGGFVEFSGASTAADSTLTALGGLGGGLGGEIVLLENANGAAARIATAAGGVFDMSALAGPGTTLGSIAGGGMFFLGGKSLAIGSAGLDTIVSGIISDGGRAGGAGATLTKIGAGILELGGINTHTGPTHVDTGTLLLTGSLGAGAVTVASAATLAGTGTIGGPVTVANNGIVAPGKSGAGTLTTGDLTLSSASVLNYQLGGLSDRIDVNGALSLDGTINLSALGGMTIGVYRLINYTGTLTDNGLALGTVPAGTNPGDFTIQTDVAGQVNLVLNGGPGELLFWDGPNFVGNGVINGGTGTWTNALTSWTNSAGTLNQSWAGQKAVFSGIAGTVTLGENVTTTGLQFVANSYIVNPAAGQSISLIGTTPVRVESGATATINTPLTGGALAKDGGGTLALTAVNTYAGGTFIDGGRVINTSASGNGLGSGSVDVAAGGALDFSNSGSAGALMLANSGGSAGNSFGEIRFLGNSTAAAASITNQGNAGATGYGAYLIFSQNAVGGSAMIDNHGGNFTGPADPFNPQADAGQVFFLGSSKVQAAQITNFGSTVADLHGGNLYLSDFATAGMATITNRGAGVPGALGGKTQFTGNSQATAATLIAEGGTDGGLGGSIEFRNSSSGGTARVILSPGDGAPGTLDISALAVAGTSISSIEGNGIVQLGSKNLTVGGGNVAAEFSGSFEDGGAGGTLTKSGFAVQTLAGDSSYTGGTDVADGVLRITSENGQGLGTGLVTVQATFVSELRFAATASAGAALISNLGGVIRGKLGRTTFQEFSSAATATILNRASLANGASGGITVFYSTSQAGSANLQNFGSSFLLGPGGTGGGEIYFTQNSTADAAKIQNGGGIADGSEGGQTDFSSSSDAGTATITNYAANTSGAFQGATVFRHNAAAGASAILNAGSVVNGLGGVTEFFDNATADAANITNFGGQVASAHGGTTHFFNSSSGGAATLNNHAATAENGISSKVIFTDSSDAAASTHVNEGGLFFIRTGGSTEFHGSSSAGSGLSTHGAGQVASAFGGRTYFYDSSMAGSRRFVNKAASVPSALGGAVIFFSGTSAGNATILNEGSSVSGAGGGYTLFNGGTAGTATITGKGGIVLGAPGGQTAFRGTARAGSATIITEGGSVAGGSVATTEFENSSVADSATLIVHGGNIGGVGGLLTFRDTTNGGTARAIVNAGAVPAVIGISNGRLDISLLTSTGMGIGSIEGGGIVSLGGKNLTVGGNHLGTEFSGTLRDGGIVNASGGSLSKTGTGTFKLTGANTFTGMTTVLGGRLNVSGSLAGAVNVVGGTFGGNGVINGGVTVGPGGVVAPGESIGTFTTLGALAFGNGSVYGLEIDSSTDTADRIAAVNVAIGIGVNLNGKEIGAGNLLAGHVFKIVDNTSGNPTTGTFAGLTENSEWTLGNHVFRISYQGGDGNDVTLTQIGFDSYWQWATATSGLSENNAAGNADPDHDGLANFIEFVLGGEPNPANPNSNSAALLPTLEVTGTHLVFTYRRTDAAFDRPGIVIQAEHGSELSGWTAAQHGVDGVTISIIDEDFGPGIDKVQVSIPRPTTKTFVRLSVEIP